MINYNAKAKNVSSPNLLLNPGFETVLYGTHTNAIARNNVAGGGTKNTQFVAWQTSTVTSNPDMTVAAETGTIRVPGSTSCKVTVAAVGGGCELRQDWSSTHFLDFMAHAARGAYLNFAMDVKLSSATANACRLEIYTDGTGGTSTYSSYHGANTDWERLLVSAQVPSDATRVILRIQFYSTTPTYYLDCGMAVTSAAAPTSLPFIPRLPITLETTRTEYDETFDLVHTAGTTLTYPTACDSGSLTIACALNSLRPPWATHLILKTQTLRNPGNQAIFYLGAYGKTNPEVVVGGYSNGLASDYNQARIEIGQDGLFAIGNADGTIQIYAAIKGYGGINL